MIVFVAGFGFSAQWVLPWSLIPDVVEHDELMTGERREGVYYGVRGLMGKVSDALGLFVGGGPSNSSSLSRTSRSQTRRYWASGSSSGRSPRW